MALSDYLNKLFGVGTAKAPTETAQAPLWQTLGYQNEDQYKLDNGIATSDGRVDQGIANNAKGLEGDGSGPIIYPSQNPAYKAPVVKPAPAPVAAGPAAPVLPDRSNSIRANEAALGGADIQKATGLAAIQEKLSQLFGGYDKEVGENTGLYNEQTDTNKNNLQRNTQAALSGAAQGRRGLFGILSSLGALSGSGIQLANRAVQQGANADITGANDTFGENAGALDSSFKAFKSADERRREEANRTAEDVKRGIENQNLTTKQKIYGSLADDYSQMGNAGKAREYTDMLAALFPDVARTNVDIGSIAPMAASFAAPTLAKYVGGDAATTVKTTPAEGASPIPGLFAMNPLRKKLED